MFVILFFLIFRFPPNKPPSSFGTGAPPLPNRTGANGFPVPPGPFGASSNPFPVSNYIPPHQSHVSNANMLPTTSGAGPSQALPNSNAMSFAPTPSVFPTALNSSTVPMASSSNQVQSSSHSRSSTSAALFPPPPPPFPNFQVKAFPTPNPQSSFFPAPTSTLHSTSQVASPPHTLSPPVSSPFPPPHSAPPPAAIPFPSNIPSYPPNSQPSVPTHHPPANSRPPHAVSQATPSLPAVPYTSHPSTPSHSPVPPFTSNAAVASPPRPFPPPPTSSFTSPPSIPIPMPLPIAASTSNTDNLRPPPSAKFAFGFGGRMFYTNPPSSHSDSWSARSTGSMMYTCRLDFGLSNQDSAPKSLSPSVSKTGGDANDPAKFAAIDANINTMCSRMLHSEVISTTSALMDRQCKRCHSNTLPNGFETLNDLTNSYNHQLPALHLISNFPHFALHSVLDAKSSITESCISWLQYIAKYQILSNFSPSSSTDHMDLSMHSTQFNSVGKSPKIAPPANTNSSSLSMPPRALAELLLVRTLQGLLMSPSLSMSPRETLPLVRDVLLHIQHHITPEAPSFISDDLRRAVTVNTDDHTTSAQLFASLIILGQLQDAIELVKSNHDWALLLTAARLCPPSLETALLTEFAIHGPFCHPPAAPLLTSTPSPNFPLPPLPPMSSTIHLAVVRTLIRVLGGENLIQAAGGDATLSSIWPSLLMVTLALSERLLATPIPQSLSSSLVEINELLVPHWETSNMYLYLLHAIASHLGSESPYVYDACPSSTTSQSCLTKSSCSTCLTFAHTPMILLGIRPVSIDESVCLPEGFLSGGGMTWPSSFSATGSTPPKGYLTTLPFFCLLGATRACDLSSFLYFNLTEIYEWVHTRGLAAPQRRDDVGEFNFFPSLITLKIMHILRLADLGIKAEKCQEALQHVFSLASKQMNPRQVTIMLKTTLKAVETRLKQHISALAKRSSSDSNPSGLSDDGKTHTRVLSTLWGGLKAVASAITTSSTSNVYPYSYLSLHDLPLPPFRPSAASCPPVSHAASHVASPMSHPLPNFPQSLSFMPITSEQTPPPLPSILPGFALSRAQSSIPPSPLLPPNNFAATTFAATTFAAPSASPTPPVMSRPPTASNIFPPPPPSNSFPSVPTSRTVSANPFGPAPQFANPNRPSSTNAPWPPASNPFGPPH